MTINRRIKGSTTILSFLVFASAISEVGGFSPTLEFRRIRPSGLGVSEKRWLSTSPSPLKSSFSVDDLPSTDAEESAGNGAAFGFDQKQNFNGVGEVLSAALMITGNTAGAGMMVLPDVAAGPGMMISSALLIGLYMINLWSGLLIAEVAIKQHESSGSQVPSSFKDFADVNLQSGAAGNFVASVSIFINWCVLSFLLVKGGSLVSSVTETSLNPSIFSAGMGVVLAGMVGTQSSKNLSKVASLAVAALFASFAGLLLPGLANVSDPIATLVAPGTAGQEFGSIFGSIAIAAPIFLQSLIYQNIVPSITKMLNYEREKTVAAISIGSLIPALMYIALCFATLGGGVHWSMSSGGPLLAAFSCAALVGSSVTCVMSLAEELGSVLASQGIQERSSSPQEGASVPSLLLAVLPPLIAGVLFSGGENFNAALSSSGSYGSPLLYGVLPVLLAWTQRQEEGTFGFPADKGRRQNLIPGGNAGIGALGAASACFVMQEFTSDVGGMLHGFVGAV